MLHAVVMAGGSGTRFWPGSRQVLPKQLLSFTGDETLIQETVSRVAPLIDAERTWVVTNAQQVEPTAQQLSQLPRENFLVEPCGRNTAPCIGLAAIALLKTDPDAIMAVMPADHVIRPEEVFREAIQSAVSLVEADAERLVLFGIPPTFPAEGYGYIQRGESLNPPNQASFEVSGFREKPDAATAQQFLETGNYYWNCGIFVWRADRILAAIQEYEPEIHQRLMTLQESLETSQWDSALQAEFPEMKSISIDHAVLERAETVCVLEAPYQWDDVGSWLALERLHASDENGNTIIGKHCGMDTSGCIVRTDADHLVATIGMRDCIIVHTKDATLVARKEDDQAIRQLVDLLKKHGYDEYL